MQGVFTKYPCYLCLWESRDTKAHYQKQVWPKCEEFVVGEKNVKNVPLIKPKKVLLPHLRFKLYLIIQFVKALDKDGAAFKFPNFQKPKLKVAYLLDPM